MKDHHFKDPDFEEFKFKPPPISGTVEERCQSALEHVSSGLKCLKYFPKSSSEEEEVKPEDQTENKSEKGKHEYDEASKNMAKPFEPIPMPYSPLSINTRANETESPSLEGSPR